MTHLKQKQTGFALLIALVVVSVVISVGLVILDLTLKQLKLSTNSKESEIAIHASNAGLECARFWRNEEADDIENGINFTPACFNGAPVSGFSKDDTIGVSGGGDAVFYEWESTWGTGLTTRCSEMSMLVIVSAINAQATVDENDIRSLIPGYPEGDKDCPAGGICTILSSKGYSRACAQKTSSGTVQREVLLEL